MRNKEHIIKFADSILKMFSDGIQQQVALIFPQNEEQAEEIKDVLDVWGYLDRRHVFNYSPLRKVCGEHKIFIDRQYGDSSNVEYIFYFNTPSREVRFYPSKTLVTIKNGSTTRSFGLTNNYEVDLVGIYKDEYSFSALKQMAASFRPFIEECITTIDKI